MDMEKKKYEAPSIDIIILDDEDIITASSPEIDEGEIGLSSYSR